MATLIYDVHAEGREGVKKFTMELWTVEDGGSGEGGGFRVESGRPHKFSLLNKIKKAIFAFHSSDIPFRSHKFHLSKKYYNIFAIWALKYEK